MIAKIGCIFDYDERAEELDELKKVELLLILN